MKLLVPLGLLGLLGLLVLILIYIIRPNYQQKLISTTFVWELSLKFKKKKRPISKLRNILLILCQVLIIVCIAAVLSQPVREIKTEIKTTEVVAIVDSSASMRAQTDGESRFVRAVNSASQDLNNLLDQGGIVSVIIADESPSFLEEKVSRENRTQLDEALNSLLEGNTACSYGTADIQQAVDLCEDILRENPAARIYLYTDEEYENGFIPKGIEVVNVLAEAEWNAAVLSAKAETNDYCMFTAEIACYGRNEQLNLKMDVYGVNASDSTAEGAGHLSFTMKNILCTEDETQTVIFKFKNENESDNYGENVHVYYLGDVNDSGLKIYSYQSVHFELLKADDSFADDSFAEDNSFDIYGGQKPVLKIQYASSLPNGFFNSALENFVTGYKDRWDVRFTEVAAGAEAALEGFDFYVFEHTMPKTMPSDGVVFLIDPDSAPTGAGFRVSNERTYNNASLTKEMSHPVMESVVEVDAELFTVSRMRVLTNYESDYDVLMSCLGAPALLVNNTEFPRTAILTFSVHYANLAMIGDQLTYLLVNMFDYFFPSTVSGTSFEIGEEISLNARSSQLTLTAKNGMELTETYTAFPATFVATVPGQYQLTQTTYFGKETEESIYIRIPRSESNIFKAGEVLTTPYEAPEEEDDYDYFWIYAAAVLVALLFIEWLLQSREGI